MCAPQGPNDHPFRSLLAPIFASQNGLRGPIPGTMNGAYKTATSSMGSRLYGQAQRQAQAPRG